MKRDKAKKEAHPRQVQPLILSQCKDTNKKLIVSTHFAIIREFSDLLTRVNINLNFRPFKRFLYVISTNILEAYKKTVASLKTALNKIIHILNTVAK